MLSPVIQEDRPKLGYTGHILDRGPVAQLGARFHGMEEVVSSNLTRSTKTFQTLTVLSQPRTSSPESNWSPNSVLRMGTVPPNNSIRSAIIEVDRLSFAPLVGAATPVHRARRPYLHDLGPATTGKPRLAATTHRLTSVGSKTPEADASRPDLLGLVATRVERLEIRPDDRQG